MHRSFKRVRGEVAISVGWARSILSRKASAFTARLRGELGDELGNLIPLALWTADCLPIMFSHALHEGEDVAALFTTIFIHRHGPSPLIYKYGFFYPFEIC
jgi:hypothetical protein